MLFAQYSYKNFHNENTEKHPIQPYHWDNWVKMVNANQRYCAKMNWIKWVELYFWIMIGRVTKVDLPSFHRYWRLQVNKQYAAGINSLIVKYEICCKDPSQIKYLFNASTSLMDIERKIIDYKIRLNLKYKLKTKIHALVDESAGKIWKQKSHYQKNRER